MLRALVAWLALAYNVRAMVRDHPRALQLPVETEEVVITEAAAPEPERGPGDAHMARKALLEDGQALLDDGGGNMRVLVSGEGDAAVPLQLTDADFDFKDLVPVEPVEPEPTRRQYVGPVAPRPHNVSWDVELKDFDNEGSLLERVALGQLATSRGTCYSAAYFAFSALFGVIFCYFLYCASSQCFVRLTASSIGDAMPDDYCNLVERFLALAAENPDRPAVDIEGTVTTYRELEQHVAHAAENLKGLEAGDRVCVLLERSLDMIVAHLALWRKGCTVVSLSPKESAPRVLMMMEDSDAVLALVRPGQLAALLKKELSGTDGRAALAVITEGTIRAEVPARQRSSRAAPDECAIHFTSGSTGRPKGVSLSHTHVALRCQGMGRDVCDARRTLWRADPSWLCSIREHWATLMRGGTIVVVPDGKEKDLEYLAKALMNVQVAVFIPALLEKVLPFCRDHEVRSAALRHVVVTGEACPPSTPAAFFDVFPDATLVNSYGATETLECRRVRQRRFWGREEMSVGTPWAGCKILLLDGGYEADAGEIYFGGSLGRYLPSVPDADQERFVVHGGELFFRTGDLGKWVIVGGERVLSVVGRADRQVKLRGMRVELDEVEAVLGNVTRTAVVQDGQQLLAFVESDAEEVRKAASRALPAHMRPATIITCKIPILTNGKTDYKALVNSVQLPVPTTSTAPELFTIAQSQHLLEQGVDSLGMMATMTPAHKNEQRMLLQMLGLYGIVFVLGHWQHSLEHTMDVRTKFNIPDGAAATFVERVLAIHVAETAVWVCAALAHSREQGFGWKKTLILYVFFVVWEAILSPVAAYLGADLFTNPGVPNAVQPVTWPKAILMYIVCCRVFTSTLEGLRCPPAVQVGASFAAFVAFQTSARMSTQGSWGWGYPGRCEVYIEPEGNFFAGSKAQWLADPPFWGNILIGRIRLDFWMLLAYSFSFHYLRRIGVSLARVCVWPRQVAVLGAAVAVSIHYNMVPFGNLYGQSTRFGFTGTPYRADALLFEIVVDLTAVTCLLATFYCYSCRPLELLGSCTFPAFVCHAFVIEKGPRLARNLPRAPGSWEPVSAVICLFAVIVGFMALSGACFHVGLWAIRTVWIRVTAAARDARELFARDGVQTSLATDAKQAGVDANATRQRFGESGVEVERCMEKGSKGNEVMHDTESVGSFTASTADSRSVQGAIISIDGSA